MSVRDPYTKISEIQDEQLRSQTASLERVKRSVLNSVIEKPRPVRAVNYRIVLVMTMVLLAVGAALVWMQSDAVSTPPILKAKPSQWLVASASKMKTVTFDDRSKIVLSPGSSARILQTAPSAVRVLLEKGSADVKVIHSEQTDWLLEAGPYTVTVTGTSFTIRWNTEEQKFSLHLKEGHVVITGPMLEEGKSVKAGERFAAWVKERKMELSAHVPETEQTDETLAIETVILPTISNLPTSGHQHMESRKQTKPTAKTASNPAVTPNDVDLNSSSWRQMCKDGKFSTVVNQATSRGLHTSIQNGSVEDLMALGEAARLTRNKMVANEAYQAVRQRYSDSSDASSAAFYLGKMAFDQHHAYGVAERWLSVYLQENTSGPFAKDALGKLFEAQLKTGNKAQAKQNARLYLQRYPAGAHAPLADRILKE